MHVHILGFVDNMHELMGASDLIITKVGSGSKSLQACFIWNVGIRDERAGLISVQLLVLRLPCKSGKVA